ncbi:MAG: hypothetical protein WB439_16840 [Acidobacteriaceae bacterium]
MRALLLLAILTTTAQAQWTLQQSPTTADLRGIDNVSPGIAWASGTNGTVLRTEDAGHLWQVCTIPPNAAHLDFRGIQAFDANTAIVMSSGKGDQSRLYKTTDGCQTWTLLFTNPDKDGFFDAIAADSKQLWILGDPVDGKFTVLRMPLVQPLPAMTKDIPCTRSQFDLPVAHALRECANGLQANAATAGAFAASNSSFFILPNAYQAYFGLVPKGVKGVKPTPVDRQLFATGGTAGAKVCERFISTTDGGEPPTWRCESVPLGAGTEASGAFSIFFNREQKAVAVGGDYLKPNDSTNTAAFTTDGGKMWHAATTPPHGFRSAVAYDAPTKTWITIGPNGTDISTDDGRNWRPLHPTPDEAPDADQHWNALSLPYAVGPHGRIGRLNPSALKPTATKP